MSTVIVSGKNGQLGCELQLLASLYPQLNFSFFGKEELDISNFKQTEETFSKHQPSFFVNCAAYTAVDKAETEQEVAYIINAEAVGNIAGLCRKYNTTLIHISTDYVFNGKSNSPYREDYPTDPVNYYGYTKCLGEKLALENNDNTIIIRTSWVYSSFGQNFVKTMIHLMKERSELRVVNDQFGSPTYAKDLAEVILTIVKCQTLNLNSEEAANHKLQTSNHKPGIYHFTNDGIISWYDFACAIKDIKHFNCIIHPVPTSEYYTAAKRPAYSVLDKEKIVTTYPIQLRNWRQSLEECLQLL